MSIYANNKYTNTYYKIVNNALNANRKKQDSQIYENHHIIPKSCGGTDDSSNLVLLTPREHYVCHKLLPKMVKNKLHYEKMIYALWCLINGNGRAKRYSANSKVYQQIKEKQSIVRSNRMSGENNSFYGKKHSDKSKKLMSENNPTKREEVKAKLKGPRKGFLPHNHYTGWSKEVKEKLRKANLGKTHSLESKQKMSATRSNKIWIKKLGEKSKHIQKEQYDYYLTLGWEKGR